MNQDEIDLEYSQIFRDTKINLVRDSHLLFFKELCFSLPFPIRNKNSISNQESKATEILQKSKRYLNCNKNNQDKWIKKF